MITDMKIDALYNANQLDGEHLDGKVYTVPTCTCTPMQT